MYYVITSFQTFLKNFHYLKEGDLVFTRIPIREDIYPLLIDLQSRGVLFFPSIISQVLSASKVAQASILQAFMPPYTYVITNQVSLLKVLQNPPPYEKFITKKDRANCGLGIKLWNNLEEIFNFAGTPGLEFPFVLQPFFKDWIDIRVVFLGDLYLEAYVRQNPKNFRQNIFFGGNSKSYELSREELDFCNKVMARGSFPYAHLDIAYVEGKGPFLSEINLKGGIKGAKIKDKEYGEFLKKIEEKFFKTWAESHSPFEKL